MEIVKELFKDRKNEVDLYFRFINIFSKINIKDKDSFSKNDKNDLENILKANSLLLLYNLVESTLISSIEKIYTTFEEEKITYNEVRDEIKDIWFNYKFSFAYDKKAHFETYKDTAKNIINSIISNETIELNRRAIGISGNLDADKIRMVCRNHGIEFKSPNECHGGEKLSKVKEERNSLAHGTHSFVECGRYYTYENIQSIRIEVEKFLEGFIDAIENYYKNKDYLRKNNI